MCGLHHSVAGAAVNASNTSLAALPLSLDKRAIAEPHGRAYFLNRAASSEPPVTLPAL